MISLIFLLRRLLLDPNAKTNTSQDSNTSSSRPSHADPHPSALPRLCAACTAWAASRSAPAPRQPPPPQQQHPHAAFRAHSSALRQHHAEQQGRYSSSSAAAVGQEVPPGRFHPLPLLHVPGHRARGHQLARPRREQAAPRPPPPDHPLARGPAPPLARREAAPEGLASPPRRRRPAGPEGASGSGPRGCCRRCGVGMR